MVQQRTLESTYGLFTIFFLCSGIILADEAKHSKTTDTISYDNIPVFRIDSLKIGPFGLYQNSADIPKEPLQLKQAPQKQRVQPGIPLSQTISALKIHGVNPSKGEFIVGLNRFRLGQILPLTKTIKVKVTEITSSSVSFRNIKNGETATIDLGRRKLLKKHSQNMNSLLSPNGKSTPLLNE